MTQNQTHKSNFRIYYEDTDAGGIVYYANYLKFAERSRTEYLRILDISQSQLIADLGVMFVVREVNVKYKSAAKLDDLISVETEVTNIKSASITMTQKILLDDASIDDKASPNGKELILLEVNIACVNQEMKPVRLPKMVKEKMLNIA